MVDCVDDSTPDASPQKLLIPAAQYVRSSTDRQEYSVEHQKDCIGKFAARRRGLKIVRSYTDPGISGVTAQN